MEQKRLIEITTKLVIERWEEKGKEGEDEEFESVKLNRTISRF